MRSRQTTGYGLDADDVFVGLVDYGLFAEKLPPCFSTEGLASAVPSSLAKIAIEKNADKLGKLLKKQPRGYARYQAVRDVNIPRHLGIPYPQSHVAQCLAIKRTWKRIVTHCAKPSRPVSHIFVRYVDGARVFAMNYRGAESLEVEEEDLKFQTGAAYVVHADISTCFPSIYTHSLPWALHGRKKAKTARGDLSLEGNVLDQATQSIRDGQTNGLLIGPHTSNILAEIVLTCVDAQLLRNGYTRLSRHIDDYHFCASSHEEAERFVRDLGLALREFELTLNERKTKILTLPRPQTENWVRELSQFQFPAGDLRHSTVRAFLDLALHLAQAAGTSAVLNYAIKMVPPRLNGRARRLFVLEAVNLALAYPYLAPMMGEHVFAKHTFPGIDSTIRDFAGELLKIGIARIYPDSIAHALYYAMNHAITLPQTEVALREIVRLDDCVCDVLLLEYAQRHGLAKIRAAITKRADNLKGLDSREQDPFWLLIYQVWSVADLRGNKHGLLADLKAAGFEFLRF